MIEKLTSRFVQVFDPKRNESVKHPLLHLRGNMPGGGHWESDSRAAGHHKCGGTIYSLLVGPLGLYYECKKCGVWKIGEYPAGSS